MRRQSILARLAIVSHGGTSAVPDGSGMAAPKRKRSVDPLAPGSGKLRALSTSTGARPSRAADSRPPQGVRQSADIPVDDEGRAQWSEGPPPRELDLHGHYVYRFQEAKGDYWATSRLCSMAERDLDREIRGNRSPFNEDGPARERRILRDYAGLPNWEVATWEGIHPKAVAKMRREAGLDDEGMEVELDERTAKIISMKRAGASQRAIAAEIGVSQARISQVLSGAC